MVYTVIVQTGSNDDAGTNAKITLTVYGCQSSWQRELKGSFEKGMVDTIIFNDVDYIGDLYCINIRHDNSGHKPGWFLEKVVINDGHGKGWSFHCHRWLAKSEDDGRISRGLAEDRFG